MYMLITRFTTESTLLVDFISHCLIDPFPLLRNMGQKCALNGSFPIMDKSSRKVRGIFVHNGVGTKPPSWLNRLTFFVSAISARF